MQRVAVVLESFGVGGREKVIIEMARVLNEFGIVPDVFTLDPPASKAVLTDAFGDDADYELKRLPNFLPDAVSGLRGPFANLMSRRLEDQYSWFINLTSSLALCGSRRPVFHYINVPERYIVLHHHAAASQAATGLRWVRRRLHEALVSRFDVPKPGQYFACNCGHARELFRFSYPGTDAVILYPPIEVNRFTATQPKKRQILNVGRYSVAKRQLDLIAIAGQLPDYQIVFAGPGEGNQYYRSCEETVRRRALSNVALLPAVPAPRLKQLMEESMFYVHLFRHEPFGMATAEAIAAGCLPVVPDAWGNREIVPVPELRFDEPAEIVERIRMLEADPQKRNNYGSRLREHVRIYDVAQFRRSFLDWIRPVVPAHP